MPEDQKDHDSDIPESLPAPFLHIRPWHVATVVTALAFLWMWLYVEGVFDGNWNGLYLAGDRFEQSPDVKAENSPVVSGAGYDGQFYHAIAHDPLHRRQTSHWIDSPRRRYFRILQPALAYMLGLGQPYWVDTGYQAVALGSLWLMAFVTSLYAIAWGCSPWWGVAILFLPVTLVSLRLSLIDLSNLALIFAAFLAVIERKWALAWLALAAAALSREFGFIAILLCSGWLGAKREWRLGTWCLSAALPAVAWIVWVLFSKVPDVPELPYTFAYPLYRMVNTLLGHPDIHWRGSIGPWMAAANYGAALGLWAALAIGLWLAYRDWRTKTLDPMMLLLAFSLVFTVIFASIKDGAPNVEFDDPNSYGRSTGMLQISLLLVTLRSRRWEGLIPLILIIPRELMEICVYTIRAVRTVIS